MRSWQGMDDVPHPGVRAPGHRSSDDWSALTNGLIITFTALLVVLALAAAWNASPVGPVRGWRSFRAPHVPLTIMYPEGWRVISDLDSQGQLHIVLARSEWVRVHIIALGDIDREIYALEVLLGGRPVAGSYRSIEVLHTLAEPEWSSIFGDMREGQVVPTRIGGRPAVWSQFEYSGGLVEGGNEPMAGLRVTFMTTRQGVLISAVAPRKYWSEFQPIALQVLGSVRIGGR